MIFRQLVRPGDLRVLRDDVARLDATVSPSFLPIHLLGWGRDCLSLPSAVKVPTPDGVAGRLACWSRLASSTRFAPVSGQAKEPRP